MVSVVISLVTHPRPFLSITGMSKYGMMIDSIKKQRPNLSVLQVLCKYDIFPPEA